MGRKIFFSFSLIFLCIGFSLTLDQILARKDVSKYQGIYCEHKGWRQVRWSAKTRVEESLSHQMVKTINSVTLELKLCFSYGPCFISRTSSNKEVVINDQQNNGDVNPIQNFTIIPIRQTLNYTLSGHGHLEKELWNAFSHDSPVNVSMDGIPCILFWAKGITIKFKNQTWLDLTDEAFGQRATVDISNSNCSEESATLSLKFGDAEIPKGLDIRFTLTNYNKLYLQSWFSLQRVEIIFNNSIQATFNATGIYAPSSYSYHCQRVSSLQRYDALLVPSYADDMSSLWEVTFVDFQIQAFPIKGRQFSRPRDCASSFSPAILIGLAMSLILLLVLAYALHMLIYLRYLERHYDFLTSPAHFPQLRARDAAEEKELLRSQGVECYELRSPQICKIYV